MALAPQFGPGLRPARSFHDGLAAVRIVDDATGKWGFLDTRGKPVVNPTFDDVDSFSEELAKVRVGSAESGK